MSRKIKIPRELRVAYDTAIEQGWVITVNGGHMKWVSPGGQPIFTGTTPSDPRAVKNHISRLKREGLVI